MRKRTLLTLLLAGAATLPSLADNVTIDGIRYITNASTQTATVTSGSTIPESGELTIPETITYNGTTYAVTIIGVNAFKGSNVDRLNVPAGIKTVYTNAFTEPTLVYFDGITPPTFSEAAFITTICVPEEGRDAYIAALPEMNENKIIAKELTDYEVSVSALENDSDLLKKVNEGFDKDMAANVVNLKVSGTINSYDIIAIRNKMLNLRSLDLSEASIVDCSYEYLAGCHTEANIIGERMFADLKITNLIYPNNVTSIKTDATSRCIYLTHVKLPNDLISMGIGVFYNCQRLTSVDLPNSITTIGRAAFQYCSNLQSIKLPEKLNSLNTYLFERCSKLTEIVIPPLVKEIPYNCFSGCSSLKYVSLPPTLESIGDDAFSGCSALTEFRIPAGVSRIGDDAIPNSVKDVYTYTIQPTDINQSTFGSDTYLNATLHVPETSEKLYYWDTQWSQFQKIENFNEPYSYFYLEDKDLIEDPDTPRIEGETNEETGDKKKPDANLGEGSGLVVEGDKSQDLGNVDIEHNGNGEGATIIGGDSNTHESGGNVNVDMLNIKIPVLGKKWYFFAFPFDIELANISCEGQMVWRYYDSEWRALHGSGSWKDVTDTKLQRGKGYIFQASKSGMLTLSVPKVHFDAKDWLHELKQYIADRAQDASWNFIGNPFQSYYELGDLGFDGPITWWNPNSGSYEAYSPQDDDFSMYPYMAFFVQKPEGVDGVDFWSQYRETRNQKNDPNHRKNARQRRKARRSPGAPERLLINLTVTDGTNSDRTRVVFNPMASDAYEVGTDASKFVSSESPQIYSLDAERVRYAINERPAADGIVKLGFYAPASGTFTISCPRTDCELTLKDCLTGISVALAAGDSYEFFADKGYDDARFILTAKGSADQSAINSLEATEADATYYDLKGIKTDASRSGVMIEVKGSEATKVLRK